MLRKLLLSLLPVLVLAYLALAGSVGCATRLIWEMGRPPLAKRFEVHLLADASDPVAAAHVAAAKKAALIAPRLWLGVGRNPS